MKKHAHVLIHSHGRQPRKPVDPPITLRDLRRIERLLGKIIMTQASMAAQLRAVEAQQVKVGGEIRSLHDKIVDLEAALAAQPEVSEELRAAVEAVRAASDTLDSLTPDLPVEEPPVEETP